VKQAGSPYLSFAKADFLMQKLRKVPSAVWWYAALILIQMKLLWGSWNAWDLPLADGAHYYRLALGLVQHLELPLATYSPAYIAFYAAVMTLLPSSGAFTIYFVQRIILIIVTNLLIYIFFRKHLSPLTALTLSAWCISISAIYACVYVVQFVPIIPLIAALLAINTQDKWREVLVLFFLGVAVLVRLETILAFIPFAALFVIRLMNRLRHSPKDVRDFWLPNVLAVGIIIFIPLLMILAPDGKEHTWDAFTMHYVWGYKDRHPEWTGNMGEDNDQVIQMEFGPVQSFQQAAYQNPPAIVEHIAWNLFRVLPLQVLVMLAPIGYIEIVALACLIIWLASCIFWVIRWLKTRDSKEFVPGGNREFAILLAIVTIPVMVSALIFRPHATHLAPIVPVLFLIIGWGIDYGGAYLKSKLNRNWLSISLATFLFLVTPRPFQNGSPQYIINLVKTITEHAPNHEDYVVVGDGALNICVYTANPHCIAYDLGQVFAASESTTVIQDKDTFAIMISPKLLEELDVEAQQTLAKLQSDPESYGFIFAGTFDMFQTYIRP
jgi:hypothetical protein